MDENYDQYDIMCDGDPVMLMNRCREAESLLETVLPHLRSFVKIQEVIDGERDQALVALGTRVRDVVVLRERGKTVPPA